MFINKKCRNVFRVLGVLLLGICILYVPKTAGATFSRSQFTSVKSGSSSVTLKWEKSLGTELTGYKIQYAKNFTFKNCKTITVSKKKTKYTIKKLKKNTTYYVRLGVMYRMNSGPIWNDPTTMFASDYTICENLEDVQNELEKMGKKSVKNGYLIIRSSIYTDVMVSNVVGSHFDIGKISRVAGKTLYCYFKPLSDTEKGKILNMYGGTFFIAHIKFVYDGSKISVDATNYKSEWKKVFTRKNINKVEVYMCYDKMKEPVSPSWHQPDYSLVPSDCLLLGTDDNIGISGSGIVFELVKATYKLVWLDDSEKQIKTVSELQTEIQNWMAGDHTVSKWYTTGNIIGGVDNYLFDVLRWYNVMYPDSEYEINYVNSEDYPGYRVLTMVKKSLL